MILSKRQNSRKYRKVQTYLNFKGFLFDFWKCFFFGKVVLLGVKNFHRLYDDLKIIWKQKITLAGGQWPLSGTEVRTRAFKIMAICELLSHKFKINLNNKKTKKPITPNRPQGISCRCRCFSRTDIFPAFWLVKK